MNAHGGVRAAEVVLPCAELEPTLAFFLERLGFRLESISPADDPAVAVISGHGVRLRIDRGARGPAGVLRLACDDPSTLGDGARELVAPNGTRIELALAEPTLVLPPVQPAFVHTRGDDASWVRGRAGMQYRDLIPGRLGGRYLASHIRIPEGGAVPDYVHFHRVRFQLIYCHRGWVRVVYEDQGPPFVLHAGDCVLQPPEIRHRVLESSPGLEVIEITCPAAHETCADHELVLPTPRVRPERSFGSQRFVRHEAAEARWRPWRFEGFECRDLGIAAATGGLVSACVARSVAAHTSGPSEIDAELCFLFVQRGSVTLEHEGRTEPLAAGDSVVIPARHRHAFIAGSWDLELLEVTAPAGAD
jgi:quercetin dioxygenase-like cupin family protein